MEDESLRYAHNDGHTFVSYDDTGKYIVTGGTDGDIRIWRGFDDDDVKSYPIGNTLTTFALKKEKIYVSSENNSVSSYTFPDIEFDEIIAQFSTEVYHIACSKDGSMVACGGGDFIIKMFITAEKVLKEFRGHTGPILSLSFDPKGEYLASSACDGTVRLWNIGTQVCIKMLNIFKKSNDLDSSSTLCRFDWSPDGEFLAIPVDKEVRFYQRSLWEYDFTLSDDCVKEVISIVAYSPFGEYIAASASNGQMLVWNLQDKKCVSRKMHEKEDCISGLRWNPSGKELAFCDMKGQMGIYSSPFSSNVIEEPSDMNEDDALSHTDVMDLFENEADDDDDGDNEFDIGAIKASLEPKIFGDDDSKDVPVKSDNEPKIQVIEAPKAPVQIAFQPSSSPSHLERRFMLWNTIGIVRCYNTEEENSIDVEFHDATVYHPLHINNTRNHIMAALSSEALLLACPKVDTSVSKLEGLHFTSWDSNKEWVIEMPENEEIEAIALGEGFAACVTDKRIVRLFTVSGIQCEVFLIPGPVVCCTAYNSQLLIAYHKGTGVQDDQYLNLMTVKVKLGGHSCIKECLLPLGPKAFLSWLGHTDEGNPCFVDTSGIVSILNTSCGAKWIPVANTQINAKSKSNTYFVIGLSEIKQEIRYILCKGSRYPTLLPRPTISVLPFSLPLCETASDKGKFEEANLRLALSQKCMEQLTKSGFDVDSELNQASKKQMDVLLKLFALAILSERECRAMGVAELMPNPRAVQLAIKYATQRHRIALAQRLGEVMHRKMEEEIGVEEEEAGFNDEVEEVEDDGAMSESLLSRINARKISLKSSEIEESVLKPKPISRVRSQVDKLYDNSKESPSTSDFSSSPSTSASISLLPKSSPLSNPFKSKSSPKVLAKKEESFSVGNIDDILNNSMKSAGSKNSSPVPEKLQPKKVRLPSKKSAPPKTPEESGEKRKFGFDLYLEENREKIVAESPDLSDAEVIKIAMKAFKEMPKSQKQRYQPNSSNDIRSSFTAAADDSGKELSTDLKENSSEISNGVVESAAKRPVTDAEDVNESEPKPKKIRMKLTQFAFTKTPK